jgi:hypothetical protein
VGKIKTAIGKGTDSSKTMRKLVTLFGKALREFIEHNSTFKPDTKGKDKGKGTAQNAAAAQKQITKLYDQAATVNSAASAKILRDIAKAKQDKAATEKAGADAAKNDGDADQASEDYVSAAINEYRAAICYYALGQLSDPNRDYTSQDVQDGELNYALCLINAAQDLADAADNEDPDDDVAEIMAELMVSAQLFGAAKAALVDLENGTKKKGVTFGAPTKKQISDSKDKADQGQTDSKSSLDSHVK